MTPLQKVAMGFVIVLVHAPFAGWDAVPDPVGWALVLAGLMALRGRVAGTDTLLGTAVLCGIVSLVTYPPAVGAHLTASMGWFLSLPQLGFAVLTCSALAPYADELGGRLRVLRWVFVALAVAPVLVFGGHLTSLGGPTELMAILADIYFVYLLFRLSKRPFATEK